MPIPSILLASDSYLGRVDADSLAEQQRMELFVTDLDPDVIEYDLNGDVDGACTWYGVTCTNGHIDKIKCNSAVYFSASIDFLMCPAHVRVFDVYGQNLRGEVQLRGVSKTMRIVSLRECSFTAALDCGALPPFLEEFCVTDNNFTSIRHICNLPEGLRDFYASERKNVEQSVQIGKLPKSDLIIEMCDSGIEAIDLEDEADRRRVFVNIVIGV